MDAMCGTRTGWACLFLLLVSQPGLAAQGARVSPSVPSVEGLEVRYEFGGGSDDRVVDSGAAHGLDLLIEDPTAVRWLEGGGLEVREETVLASAHDTGSLVEALQASGEITLEAWVAPASRSQTGPARILSFSSDTVNRNFTLGQTVRGKRRAPVFDVRLRTTATSKNGLPSLHSRGKAVRRGLQHVLYTRSADGTASLWVNGVEVGTRQLEGDFSNWAPDMPLLVANELTGDRPWRGSLYGLAIYSIAFSPERIAAHFAAGPPARPERISAGTLSLYTFARGTDEGVVRDVAGLGPPLDLRIQDPAAVAWLEGGGLEILAPTLIASRGPAGKIHRTVIRSGALSVEAWIEPRHAVQEGPARIASLSESTVRRNFTLGQGHGRGAPSDEYVGRLRTTKTDLNGVRPQLHTPPETARATLQHVVYTRGVDGRARIFVDGRQVARRRIDGDLHNWDPGYPFLLANELTGDRPWLGTYHLVAVYGRALSGSEVLQNYLAGIPSPPVSGDPATIEISPAAVLMTASDEKALEARVWDADGRPLPRAEVEWAVSDPESGLLTREGRNGQRARLEALAPLAHFTVTARSGEVEASAEVLVVAASPDAVLLDPEAILEASEDEVVLRLDRLPRPLSPGQILVASAVDASRPGLLARVEEMEREGSRIVVRFSPATLDEAFDEVEIEATGEPVTIVETFTLEEGEERRAAPRSQEAGGGFECELEEALGDTEVTMTGFTVTRTTTFTPHLDLSRQDGVTSFALYADVEVGFELEGPSLKVTNVTRLGFECTRELPGVPLGAVAAGPILLLPEVTPRLGVEGGIAIEMVELEIHGPSASAHYSGRYGLGYRGEWYRIEESSFELGTSGFRVSEGLEFIDQDLVFDMGGFLAFRLGLEYRVIGIPLGRTDFLQLKMLRGLRAEVPFRALLPAEDPGYEPPAWKVFNRADVSLMLGITIENALLDLILGEDREPAELELVLVSIEDVLRTSPSSRIDVLDEDVLVGETALIDVSAPGDYRHQRFAVAGVRSEDFGLLGEGVLDELAQGRVGWSPQPGDSGEWTLAGLVYDDAFGDVLDMPYKTPPAETRRLLVTGEDPCTLLSRAASSEPPFVLHDWSSWSDWARSAEPADSPVANRDCRPGYFSRFILYEDLDDGTTHLEVTDPLTFETRGTDRQLREMLVPPDVDPSCVEVSILASGWVSHAEWGELYRPPGASGDRLFLFTDRAFTNQMDPGDLAGRIEPRSEYLDRDTRAALVTYFTSLGEETSDKMFPSIAEDNSGLDVEVLFPNYPEPAGEFAGRPTDGLIAVHPTAWIFDASGLPGFYAPYHNDPEERRELYAGMDGGGSWIYEEGSRAGELVDFDYSTSDGTTTGLYAVSCMGQMAIKPRTAQSPSGLVAHKHSQPFGGAHVRSAGIMLANDGELCYIDNGSGHYRPTADEFRGFLESELSELDLAPLQPLGDFHFTVPANPSATCQAIAGNYLGVVVTPHELLLEAPLGATVSASASLRNFSETAAEFELLFEDPSGSGDLDYRPDWLLSVEPEPGVVPALDSLEVTFEAACGAEPSESTVNYILVRPADRAALSVQVPRLRLVCANESTSEWPARFSDSRNTSFNASETTVSPPLSESWRSSDLGLRMEEGVVAGGNVFAYCAPTDGEPSTPPFDWGDFSICAVEVADGSLVWRKPLEELIPGEVHPSELVYGDGALYFTNGNSGDTSSGELNAISAADGSLLWRRGFSSDLEGTDPVYDDGTIFLVGFFGRVRAIDAVDPDHPVLWSQDYERGSHLVVTDDTVYVMAGYEGDFDDDIVALERTSGAERWVNREPTGHIRYRHLVANPDDGLLYYRYDTTSGELLLGAVDMGTGVEEWTFSCPFLANSSGGPPALADAGLYLVCNGIQADAGRDTLYALDPASGGVTTEHPVPPFDGGRFLTMANGIAYLAERTSFEDKQIRAMDTTTGSVLWESSAASTWSHAIIAAGRVLAGRYDGDGFYELVVWE